MVYAVVKTSVGNLLISAPDDPNLNTAVATIDVTGIQSAVNIPNLSGYQLPAGVTITPM